MTCSDYRRARSPDQKAERTELLVAAARELLDAGTAPAALSLADLAARAGMAKSNVYRYFESREAVLLAVLADDAMAWTSAILARLPAVPTAGPARARLLAVVDVAVDETLARPRLCELLSVMPSVLEHNVGVETVTAFKRGSAAAQQALVDAACTLVPEVGPRGHQAWLKHAITLVIGAWPLSHPPEAVREALREPDLTHLRHDLGQDLRDGMRFVALGLLADVAAAS